MLSLGDPQRGTGRWEISTSVLLAPQSSLDDCVIGGARRQARVRVWHQNLRGIAKSVRLARSMGVMGFSKNSSREVNIDYRRSDNGQPPPTPTFREMQQLYRSRTTATATAAGSNIRSIN